MLKHLLSLFAILLSASVSQAQSIRDLPELSKILIHHYECRVAYIAPQGSGKELTFLMTPEASGHAAFEQILVAGENKIVASTNNQMLQIEWTRRNRAVASSQAMIQNSPTASFVLIVIDPENADSQAHLSCNGVSFAEIKR